MDAEMLANPCINGWLKAMAKKKKIPLQYEVSSFGTTDALSISVSQGGVPTAVVGVPIRNLHSATGVVNLNDVKHAIQLLAGLLKAHNEMCTV